MNENINIMDHQNFVYKQSHYYRQFGADFSDLAQEGFIGLLEAKDRFDSSKGYKFLTYAGHYVKKRMRDLLNKNNKIKTTNNEDCFFYLSDKRTPLSELKIKDNNEHIIKLVSDLPKHEKELIYDRFFVGMTLKELEKKYGVSFVACKIRVDKILKKLRKLY
jgi:RNA polymerase sigma factor (sigma-70 family)